MSSIITLTFNSIPAEGTSLTIDDNELPSSSFTEVFRELRTTIGESTNPQLGSPEISAFNFRNAFNSDYNFLSRYIVTSVLNVVTIEGAASKSVNFELIENTTNGAVTLNIDNFVIPQPLTIDNLVIQEADLNPCDNVKISVETSELSDSLESPLIENITLNPHVFTTARSGNILVKTKKDEVFASASIYVPKLLSSFFNIDIISTPTSSTLNVTNTFLKTPYFNIEYSLDNVNWQTSTNFSNLTIGDYTLYIRDNIGCSTTKTFSIDEFSPNLLDYSAICEISNINSIRFKEDVIWSDAILKTPFNTLSFEEFVKLPNNSFTQLWNRSDLITTQIKTNYSNIVATLIDENHNETDITVFKKTANMNITDIRDAVVVSVPYNSSNYVGIKFSGGSVYDAATLAQINDYNIGINVPSWFNSGDYVNIEGVGWYKVEDIVYNDDANVLVLNMLYNDFPIVAGTHKVTSVYNAVDWENYEFDIEFDTEGYFKIKVKCTDSNFESKTFLSEWQNVRTNHFRTFLIESYNTENNEINYSTGISHKLRIPYVIDLVWKTNTEQEIYVTDTNTTALENKYRGFWEFTSKPLPTIMAEKLALILLQDRLFINNVNYVAEGEIETTPVGSQYIIKANLVKANYVFDSNSGINLGDITLDAQLLSIGASGGFLRVD